MPTSLGHVPTVYGGEEFAEETAAHRGIVRG